MIEGVRQPKLGMPPGVEQRDLLPLPAESRDVARGVPAEHGSFAGRLGDALREVSSIQMESAEAQQKLVRGEPIDLHEVLIRQQEARVAFTMLVETRNKLVEAYQEIIKMSV